MTADAELDAFLEKLPFGIFAIDERSEICFANGFARVAVFGNVDIVGMRFEEFIERYRFEGETLGSIIDAELEAELLLLAVETLVGDRWQRRYYSVTVVGPASDGERTVFVLQDSSPIVGLGRWANRILEQAKEKDGGEAMLAQLAREVAHLVRNPLASMTINASLLSRNPEVISDVDRRDIAEDIEDAAARIADVVDRLVGLGALGVGHPESILS